MSFSIAQKYRRWVSIAALARKAKPFTAPHVLAQPADQLAAFA
jgi:hypothetical protein